MATVGVMLACAGRENDFLKNQTGVSQTDDALGMTFLSESNPSLVVFGASWCKPCIAEIPYIEQIHQAYLGRVDVFGYLTEGPLRDNPTDEDVENFNYKNVRTYTIFKDSDQRIWNLISGGNKPFPTLYFFSKDRSKAQDALYGKVSQKELNAWVEKNYRIAIADDSNQNPQTGGTTLPQPEPPVVVPTPEPIVTPNIAIPTTRPMQPVAILGPPSQDGDKFSIAEFFTYYEDKYIQVFRASFTKSIIENQLAGADDPDIVKYQIEDADVLMQRQNPVEQVKITHVKENEYQACETILFTNLSGEYQRSTGSCRIK